MAALGKAAGVATPTMDALIRLASVALGVDYARDGLTLARLGLAGKTADEIVRFASEGDGHKGHDALGAQMPSGRGL
ncbi:MAG: hypothetical protein JO228_02295, partial [Xanthobacteraceae bacterium]|nr:hypothetical protein [Xanthobacteraceae bacterium]